MFLIQSLAFWEANAKKSAEGASARAYKKLLDHLSELVLGKNENGDLPNLLSEELKKDTEQYRQDTNEALACLVWLKRFADALLPEETGGN